MKTNIQQSAAESGPYFADSANDKAYREGFEAGYLKAKNENKNPVLYTVGMDCDGFMVAAMKKTFKRKSSAEKLAANMSHIFNQRFSAMEIT